MKTLDTSIADPGPVTVHANLGNIAELFAVASAIANPAELNGLGDGAQVAIVTTAGVQRRLLAAQAAELKSSKRFRRARNLVGHE